MLALFIASCINFADPDQNKTSFGGIGAALMFGVGGLLVGVVLDDLEAARLPAFFRRRSEVFDPAGVTLLYRSVTVIVEEIK